MCLSKSEIQKMMFKLQTGVTQVQTPFQMRLSKQKMLSRLHTEQQIQTGQAEFQRKQEQLFAQRKQHESDI